MGSEPKSTLPLSEVIRRLCDVMARSVAKHEVRDHRRRGCMAGIGICRTLTTVADFERVLAEREKHDLALRDAKVPIDEYWEARCATAQVEYAYEVVKVACGGYASYSSRAVMQFHQLLGN